MITSVKHIEHAIEHENGMEFYFLTVVDGVIIGEVYFLQSEHESCDVPEFVDENIGLPYIASNYEIEGDS